MQILLIIYITLAIISLVAQVLLYKNKSKNIIFIFNMLLAVLLAYLVFTSLPENYIVQRNISLGIGTISIIAILLKSINEKFVIPSKIMLTISILGGFIQLFI